MAVEDLDAFVQGNRQAADAVTAPQQLEDFGESLVDIRAKEAAAAAGVKYAAFINYDGALDAYAARTDIEDLAHKNARNHPADFADANFMRTAGGEDAAEGNVSAPEGGEGV